MSSDLPSLRREYARAGLSETDLAPTWYAQFGRWFADAGVLREPNAMVLGTATPGGVPSARTVLLKGVDPTGFVFFTNHGSRKGTELAANPQASLVFPWIDLERQVVIAGTVEPVGDAATEAYFRTRPRGAQVGAWASRQSQLLAGREELEARAAALEAQFAGEQVPVPPYWGGLRVVPISVEFWQGRPSRLHDRLRYRLSDTGWVVERLSP
jgi:pyridoxamine 5'-phosphate oxidase